MLASCFAGFTSLSFEDGNGNENCLYFSQDGQFPFMTVNEATDERFTNAAEVRCKRFGLELATIRSVQEFEAILGAASEGNVWFDFVWLIYLILSN